MSTPPEIPVWEESLAYWDATRDRRLLLQWCRPCAAPIHFPRVACPRCLGDDLEHREASGRGTVHAFTVEHGRPPARLRDRTPYVVALVDLDEGVRLMTNIVGCDPSTVRVGQRVTLTWEPAGDADGLNLPVFHLEEETS